MRGTDARVGMDGSFFSSCSLKMTIIIKFLYNVIHDKSELNSNITNNVPDS